MPLLPNARQFPGVLRASCSEGRQINIPGGRPGLVTFLFAFRSPSAGMQGRRWLFIKPPGGRPGAGHFLLRGQMKVTKEKAALVSLRLRVPCVTQRVRGLRISLDK